MLTGESVPVVKQVGDKVVAGSINGEGAFQVRVEQVLRNTALAKIVALMDEAQASKAPIQTLADRIVPWFVLITLTLASLTFLYWFQSDFEVALLAAVSVLVVTCPCAFGLATPMSAAVATGVGAQRGVLVKQGETLERLSSVNHFVFDKTGTLTTGQLNVHMVEPCAELTESELLQLAASVEQNSEHTIATAICETAASSALKLLPITKFTTIPGRGVTAYINDKLILVGTRQWLNSQDIDFPEPLTEKMSQYEKQGISCVSVAVDGAIKGIIGLTDSLRPDALSTIQLLQSMGTKVTVLSGDRLEVVNAVTQSFSDIQRFAEVLPQDKSAVVKSMQAQGDIVAMVGDGVNDAPALIQADVGIALASGTDVSVESADVVLSHQELIKVAEAKLLASTTLRIIRQNIMLSISYNVIMVPLAMCAWVNPLVAAITMPISSLLVIGNSARIGRLVKK